MRVVTFDTRPFTVRMKDKVGGNIDADELLQLIDEFMEPGSRPGEDPEIDEEYDLAQQIVRDWVRAHE